MDQEEVNKMTEYEAMVALTEPSKMYDPNVPVVKWRNHMCLATVIVCNSLSFLILITQLSVQRRRFGRFRKVDIWTMCVTVLLVLPFWTTQMMMLSNGTGYHIKNVKMQWRIPHWKWSTAWSSFYIVEAMVKISLCVNFLPMIPEVIRSFRIMLYTICVVSMSLAIAVMLVWIFQCRPFMSNFSMKPMITWCADIDAARYTWAAVSIVIDLLLVYTPLSIVRQVHLSKEEVRVLYVVFCGNLLGTAATGASCYGIWVNRVSEAHRDLGWTETIYLMCNSIEILFYVLGSSLIAFSHHFIGRKTMKNKNGERVAGRGQVRELNLSIFNRIRTQHGDKTCQGDEEAGTDGQTTLRGHDTSSPCSDPKLSKPRDSVREISVPDSMELQNWQYDSGSSRNHSIVPMGSLPGSAQTLIGMERVRSASAISAVVSRSGSVGQEQLQRSLPFDDVSDEEPETNR